MLARTSSLVLQGITPIRIEIEINGHQGIPGLIVIGLPAKAVDEAKERITSSLHHCQIRIRGKRTVVNLAPADLRKTSASLDFPMAVGLLAMYGEVPPMPASTALLGELALDGQLKPLPNAVALIAGARKLGFTQLFLPEATPLENISISGITLTLVRSLDQFISWTKHKAQLSQYKPRPLPPAPAKDISFDQIKAQDTAKRVLIISAAGNHHLLLSGPPGVGKTLLAQALISLLPPLSEDERLEIQVIHSLRSGLPTGYDSRPFRSPHHSVTVNGLIGGTSQFMPGEVTLAHRGVLCLDELPEFKQPVLETLRQPLEQQTITITNGHGSVNFPCEFLLVATANPCPCGLTGSTTKNCHCSLDSKLRYQQKLSGPLMDRIDLHHSVDPWINPQTKIASSITSQQAKQSVLACRERQAHRYKPHGYYLIAQLPTQVLERTLNITLSAKTLATQICDSMQLSLRSYYKLLKVAQTIADLDAADKIQDSHIAEAAQYRQPRELEQWSH